MHYRYAPLGDHRDLASGTVLHSRPGEPAFPVRLARELFARARHHRGSSDRVTIWDPCCGSAQLLITLGLAERRHLSRLVGSDVDRSALALATRNAALVTTAGLTARHAELSDAARQHGRPSHHHAAAASLRLAAMLRQGGGDLPIELHHADALDPEDVGRVAAHARPDIVFADLPHGRLTSWQTDHDDLDPTATLARRLASALPADVILVLVARSRRAPLPPGTRALDRLRVGHRSAAITRAGWLTA